MAGVQSKPRACDFRRNLWISMAKMSRPEMRVSAIGRTNPSAAAAVTGGRKILAAQREDWGRFIAALSEVAGVKPA